MKVKKGYTYDDVLLIPKKSPISSRSQIDTSVSIGNKYKGTKLTFRTPFVSANMKHVTGPEMARTMSNFGAMAILHRFQDSEEEYQQDYASSPDLTGVSVGVKDIDKERFARIYQKHHPKIVCVDIAHGHSNAAIDMVKHLSTYNDVLIIAGNVCTVQGYKELSEAGADVVKVGVGPGCFAAGTRILMSNGTYKNIEDVKVGDRIINKDGIPKKVLKAFSTGVRKVSKIRNSIFYKDTYVTPDHKYFIGDLGSVSDDTLKSSGYAKVLSKSAKNGESKFKWCEIGDDVNKCLLMPREIKFELQDSFSHDILIRDGGNGYSSVKVKKDFTLTPSYDLGYIFGTFLGDEHANLANNGKTDIGSINWHFGLYEENIAIKLRDAIKRITGRELVIEKGSNVIKCILYHKPFAEFLSLFGKKTEKHLPHNFLVNNTEYLCGILDGLVDSDGNIEENGRVCFKNTSVKLIELFNVATYLRNGVFPNNQKDKPSTGNLKGANIENFNTPYVARINKTGSKRLVDDFQVSKLLEYTETDNEVEVFDLTIDCETHSFIADNAIVHNSLCTTRIQTGNGVPQLSALADIADFRINNINYASVIADGGIKAAGDIVKALCFADMVMIGSLLAGTEETPGGKINVGSKIYKEYSGSSTHKQNHIEGVKKLVEYKGAATPVLQGLYEGLISGMSYQGSWNLIDLKKDPEFVEISNAGFAESKPHIIGL